MIPSQKTQSPSNDLHRPPQACSCSSNVLAPFLFHSLCFRAVAFAGKINTPILSSPHLLPVSASQWGSEQPLPPVTQTCTRLLAVIECTIYSAFLIMFLLISLSDATVFFFPFSLFTCIHTCVHVHADSRLTLGMIPTLFHHIHWAGSLNQTQSSQIWLVSLARLFWGSYFCLQRLEWQVGLLTGWHSDEFWESELWSPRFHSKCF